MVDTYTPTTPGRSPKKSFLTSDLYFTRHGIEGLKGVGPSLLYILSISSASYTNSKSGLPIKPPKRTIRPYLSRKSFVTFANSDISNWPITGIIRQVFPNIGMGLGPGTSEYGLALAKISSLNSAVGATCDCWRLEKGQPDDAYRTFFIANGREYAAKL